MNGKARVNESKGVFSSGGFLLNDLSQWRLADVHVDGNLGRKKRLQFYLMN